MTKSDICRPYSDVAFQALFIFNKQTNDMGENFNVFITQISVLT